VISFLLIWMSREPAFMLADHMSERMPRCICSPMSAMPRTNGSFQNRLV